VPDVDDPADERSVDRVLAEAMDEPDVDLELVEREHAERGEGCGATRVVQ
jgi:hypothetical protein